MKVLIAGGAALALLLGGCAAGATPTPAPSPPLAFSCGKAVETEVLKVKRIVRATRGSEIKIKQSAVVHIGGYRLVAVFIVGALIAPDGVGPYPSDYPLVWITDKVGFFSEISEKWDGSLPNGEKIDPAVGQAARTAAIECLKS